MKRFIFWVLSSLLLAGIIAAVSIERVSAGPAAPNIETLEQPDGASFFARKWGDEWANGYETLEGYAILQAPSGWWVFARLSTEGQLEPAIIGGKQVPANLAAPASLQKHLRPAQIPTYPTIHRASPEGQNIGTQPTLVLLASFSDRSGTYTAASFSSLVFSTTSNSVRDYYLSASFNQLSLNAAAETHGTSNDGVVGWFNLGYAHPDTGAGVSVANQLIAKNVLIAADPYVNFALFDTNSDGYISQNELHLIVVVAGYERSYSNNSPSIWGHRDSFYDITAPTLDGKILGDPSHNGGYAQIGEIHQNHQATIGILIHELGHDLTWPDLYDIDGSSDGVGDWSIMGTGSWNYTGSNDYGTSPAFPDAWLKWYQGWISPIVINGTVTGASLPQAETNATAYLLCPNPGGIDWEWMQHSGSGEYFLVENRQLTGYDAGLPGAGINILHIDESVTYSNSANANEYHPLMKFMQADGLDELLYGDSIDSERGDNGDPFPGVTNNRTFNYNSTPNSRLYSGADSQAAVTSISNSGTTMTATLSYTGPTNQPPVANAGMDLVLYTQVLVTLDGSGSYDPDGNYPLSYSWSQTSGPTVTLNNPNSVNPTFTAPSQPSILTFALVVTDSLGGVSSPDYVKVTILNTPPVANAGPDQSVNTTALVTLDGSGSYDPDGNYPLIYAWFQKSGPVVALSNPGAVNPNFIAPPIKCVLTFDLIVTDSLGQGSGPDSVSIIVGNQAPVADAGPDQSVLTNFVVILDGSQSYDPDGNYPLSYHWTQTAGPTVSLLNPETVTPSFVAPSDPTLISFSLVVTDSFGMSSAADSVNITVMNQAPIANAGQDQIAGYLSKVTLDGSASTDPDGDFPLTYAWSQTGGPNVQLINPMSVSPYFITPWQTSMLTFSLVVTDAYGLGSAPAFVRVFVSGNSVFLPMLVK
jgi:M6 family metalloprotease-like protein